MRVRTGWSGEVEPNVWRKVDVELDETDLGRLMVEGQLPEGFHERLPSSICFALLEAEAENQLLGKLIKQFGYPEAKGVRRREDLTATKVGILGALRHKVSAGG